MNNRGRTKTHTPAEAARRKRMSNARAYKKLRNARTSKGLCLWCGREPSVNPATGKRYVLCDDCRAKESARAKARRRG